MPTYVYQCTACGHEYERFESITAKPNKTCPKCHKKKGERQISGGAGVIFKGSGFYTTDYRKSSYKESAKMDSASSSSSSSGSSESKPSGGEAKSSTGEAKSGGETKSKSSDKGKGKSK
ncbi:MAG: zinc ribbon domain-containing protein [Planctomycetes bacterium]|nr:zinc ribbon domain-containing protein [Planctomycetota bacterium]